MNKAIKTVVASAAGALTAAPAMAAVDLTGVTLDTTTPETLAATILGGLAVLWGIRKVIKIINRS
jgi:hypothetical protein